MNKHVSCEYACLHFGSFSLQYCQTLTWLTVKGLLTVQYEHACMVLMYFALFRILRDRPCPCRYLTHLYVICGHFILSCLRCCSRATLFVRFYPNRASVMKTPFPTIAILHPSYSNVESWEKTWLYWLSYMHIQVYGSHFSCHCCCTMQIQGGIFIINNNYYWCAVITFWSTPTL